MKLKLLLSDRNFRVKLKLQLVEQKFQFHEMIMHTVNVYNTKIIYKYYVQNDEIRDKT